MRHLLAAATLLALAMPQVALAQTWHGKIACGPIPRLDALPLHGDFAMSADGPRLSYSRPVHVGDSATLSGVMETGQGTLAGDHITLQGSAAGRGYSYTATYEGRIEGAAITLDGEQVWTSRRLNAPYHRACHITLAR